MKKERERKGHARFPRLYHNFRDSFFLELENTRDLAEQLGSWLATLKSRQLHNAIVARRKFLPFERQRFEGGKVFEVKHCEYYARGGGADVSLQTDKLLVKTACRIGGLIEKYRDLDGAFCFRCILNLPVAGAIQIF